ncbi:MAG: CARDB domain-containing protein [Caldilineaceae bacterium]
MTMSGPSGNRDVGVVDPNNTISEGKESRQRRRKAVGAFHCRSPNLVMLKTNIGFDPIGPTEGDTVTIRFHRPQRWQRRGNRCAGPIVDGTQNAAAPIGEQQTIASIPAGGSGVAEVTYETGDKAGDRKIKIVVDPHNFIAESKETDNSSEETLQCRTAADTESGGAGG